jgi:DNA mismatch repair protein MutS
MDEVGRGTGTNDGLSIAWAVSEYLLEKICSKTLFATHYHELTTLEHPKLNNLSLDVIENDKEIIFLKRIKEGPADASYGIHVAGLAGLPAEVIGRAADIQKQLEKGENHNGSTTRKNPSKQQTVELFSEEEMIRGELLSIDINNSTPLQALNILSRWQNNLKKNK